MSKIHNCVVLGIVAAGFAGAACGKGGLEGDPSSSSGATNSNGNGETAGGSGGAGGEQTSAGGGGEGGLGAAGGAGGTGDGGGYSLGCAENGDALLCDDFESGAIDTVRWSKIEKNGAQVTVDDAVVFEGDYALRVKLPSADAASGALSAKDLFPLVDHGAAANAFYGRAYMYISPEAPEKHSKIITAIGPLDGKQAQYRLDCNGTALNSRYTTPFINENIQHGGLKKFGYEPTPQQWVCVEWHYDGENSEMRYWFDGVAVDSMTVLASERPQWTAPVFNAFEIGWHTFQAGSQSSYDIYFDAIVLAEDRIYCGQ